ncbi:MAG: hypothetical protein RL220_576 [Bacteroidota bacterium]
MPVLTKALLTLVGGHLMSLSLLTARHCITGLIFY